MNELAWRHAHGDRQSARPYDLWDEFIFFPLRQRARARVQMKKKWCVAGAAAAPPRLPMHARGENLLIFIHPRGGRSIYYMERQERARAGALTRRHSRARPNLMNARARGPVQSPPNWLKAFCSFSCVEKVGEREREVELNWRQHSAHADRALIRLDNDRVSFCSPIWMPHRAL